MTITTKRIYEPPSEEDGYRVLVDRLWPRGVAKDDAQLDDWAKEIAPSGELRTWFGHKQERFAEFTERYLRELADHRDELAALRERGEHGTVTLVYGAHDERYNQAVVLQSVLTGNAKVPSTA